MTTPWGLVMRNRLIVAVTAVSVIGAGVVGFLASQLYGVEKPRRVALVDVALEVTNGIVTLTRTAPEPFDGLWTASIQSTEGASASPGCQAVGNADYEGTQRVSFDLLYGMPGCGLEMGREYYFRACWTPANDELAPVCARSNVFIAR